MAYVSKRVYGILMAKAKKDVKAQALLNMLSDMDQQEANAQIRTILFNKSGGSPMTKDYEKDPKEPKRKDRAAIEANKLVDSGEYDNYDDAYNQIAKEINRYGPAYILKQYNLPLEYKSENLLLEMFEKSENLLLEMFENTGIEVKSINKDNIVVVIDGEEDEIPFIREEDKINFITK